MKQKKALILVAGLLVLLLLATSGAGAATLGEEGKVPTLIVKGEGIVSVAPDEAKLVLGVTSTGTTAAKAQAANIKACNQVIDQLIQAGIPKEKIQTSGYNLWPQFDYSKQNEGKAPAIIGYQVNQTVTATINQLELVGPIIDATVSSGANRIDQLSFSRSDASAARQEALSKAVADARAKADVIAAAMGVQIIGVETVSEDAVSLPAPYYAQMKSMDAGMGSNAPQIMAGQLDIRASVQIIYRIQ